MKTKIKKYTRTWDVLSGMKYTGKNLDCLLKFVNYRNLYLPADDPDSKTVLYPTKDGLRPIKPGYFVLLDVSNKIIVLDKIDQETMLYNYLDITKCEKENGVQK